MLKLSSKKYNPPEYRGSPNVLDPKFYHYRFLGNSSWDTAAPHSIMSLVNTSTNVPDDQILRWATYEYTLHAPYLYFAALACILYFSCTSYNNTTVYYATKSYHEKPDRIANPLRCLSYDKVVLINASWEHCLFLFCLKSKLLMASSRYWVAIGDPQGRTSRRCHMVSANDVESVTVLMETNKTG